MLSFSVDYLTQPIRDFKEDDRSSESGSANTSGESHNLDASSGSAGEEIESPPRGNLATLSKLTDAITSKLEADCSDLDKPSLSYIALISMAILNAPDKKLLLGDIYQYIMDKFPCYGRRQNKAWRNSIRHNLSLNECFIKNGRADNGKGNFWSVHPACVEDFKRGDYRRRQARRRARRSQQPQLSCSRMSAQKQDVGYVPMTQMPTGVGLPYQQYYPYPTQSYFPPQQTQHQMTPSTTVTRYPASAYFQPSTTPTSVAPPNVTTTQLTQQYGNTTNPSCLYMSAPRDSTYLNMPREQSTFSSSCALMPALFGQYQYSQNSL